MDNASFRITSKIGTFTFAEGTPLSLAKLVRDTVMGQFLAPAPRTTKINNVEEAYRLIRMAESEIIRAVRFELKLTPEYEGAAAYHFRKAGEAFDDLSKAVEGLFENSVNTIKSFSKLIGANA